MYKNIGAYYIYDGQRKEPETFEVEIKSEVIVYEVIRVFNGKPLFLKDHLDRLAYSLEQKQMSIDLCQLELDIIDLSKNLNLEKNIKIDVYDGHSRVYYMESNYPNPSLYDTGVKTTVLEHLRIDPNIKQLDMAYKARIEAIKGETYFEVLLKNQQGCIIEGSRANLVFIKGETLFSAPLEDILIGITFKNVIRMAELLNFKIVYKAIEHQALKTMDAAFLTGTSLGILPISSIDDVAYDTHNNIILKLLSSYGNHLGGL